MLVALSAKSNSGKDAIADYLVKNKYFIKISVADQIKRICKEVFDFSDEQLFGPSEMRNIPDERYPRFDGNGFLTVRDCLQSLGTEWARNLNQDIWINYVIKTIKILKNNPNYKYYPVKGLCKDSLGFDMLGRNKNVVVPDCRFNNELCGVKKEKAYLIRIIRDCSGLEGTQGKHKSEIEQDGIPDRIFDDIIENNGTLEELYAKIDRVIGKYKFLETY